MSGKYIVVFKDGASDEQIQEYMKEVNNNGGQVTQHYESVLKGFSAKIPDSFMQQLKAASLQGGPIDYIEPDGVVTTQ